MRNYSDELNLSYYDHLNNDYTRSCQYIYPMYRNFQKICTNLSNNLLIYNKVYN